MLQVHIIACNFIPYALLLPSGPSGLLSAVRTASLITGPLIMVIVAVAVVSVTLIWYFRCSKRANRPYHPLPTHDEVDRSNIVPWRPDDD